MQLDHQNGARSFSYVLDLHAPEIQRGVDRVLSELIASPGATIGTPRGPLGQVPQNCRLTDCCDYTRRNGLNHLRTFARSIDSPAMTDWHTKFLASERLLLIDLGSGASLVWILIALAGKNIGRLREIIVINVDHSRNMHRISNEVARHFHPLLSAGLSRIDQRQAHHPAGIESFVTSELSSIDNVLLVLNHILHQNDSSDIPIPSFLEQALNSTLRVALRAQVASLHGISIEPWGLHSGFGQRGLITRIRSYGGSAGQAHRIAGDRAGKSVVGFSLPLKDQG